MTYSNRICVVPALENNAWIEDENGTAVDEENALAAPSARLDGRKAALDVISGMQEGAAAAIDAAFGTALDKSR